METPHTPVTDWTSDFDHLDPAWASDPFPIWDEIRQTCPVGHTGRYGGAWLPTRHEDVAAIATDPDRFSSRGVIVNNHRPGSALAEGVDLGEFAGIAEEGFAPPITADPPAHAPSRKMLLGVFSPRVIDALEPSTRAYCQELIAGMAGRDVVDAATEYAQHIPVRVIANMLGLPESDGDRFRGFVHDILEGIAEPFEARLGAFLELYNYLLPHVEDRIANPRDDLITHLVQSEIDGEPLTPFHVIRTVGLLLVAGIDTTWSAIGASLWHLASNPADRDRLVAEPDLMPTAVEELLRAYAPVTMARLVRDDIDFNGCPMKSGDWILLSFPAANRDPEAFDRPDEILLDRMPNRHAAFGLGAHRCAGSHLARMELRVALEEWVRAHPVFELDDPGTVRWSGGQVRGPRALSVKVG